MHDDSRIMDACSRCRTRPPTGHTGPRSIAARTHGSCGASPLPTSGPCSAWPSLRSAPAPTSATATTPTSDRDRMTTTRPPARTNADPIADEVAALRDWMEGDRFRGLTRLHTPRQVAEQRGTIETDYTVARNAARDLWRRLRELFEERSAITTFGPYSPGQAVAMKRAGIEGIYLGGWATSAKGSATEDPGPDLASYPLSPGSRRGRRHRPRAPHRGPQPALRPRPDEPGGARAHAGGRLPAAHHRRRRHRPRRRRPRPQSRPAVRGGRRAGLPHRGPEARRQEVRSPGRQGARAVRRADQAPQRRAPPAGHHGRAGHRRGPDRCGGREPARRIRRRARPAVHPGCHPPRRSPVQARVPGAHAPAA